MLQFMWFYLISGRFKVIYMPSSKNIQLFFISYIIVNLVPFLFISYLLYQLLFVQLTIFLLQKHLTPQGLVSGESNEQREKTIIRIHATYYLPSMRFFDFFLSLVNEISQDSGSFTAVALLLLYLFPIIICIDIENLCEFLGSSYTIALSKDSVTEMK